MAFASVGLNVWSYMDNTTVLVFIVTFLTVALYILTRRESRVPPGPPVVPIIGNLLSAVSTDPLENFALLREKYGDIYGLYIGKQLTIILNSYDAINEAFLKKGSVFSRRPMTSSAVAVGRYNGLVGANDKQWKEQRGFTQRALQQLCFKNKSQHIEEIILSEVDKLLDKIEKFRGPLNSKKYLYVSTANIISRVIWNKSSAIDDPEFSRFLEEINESSVSLVKKLVLIDCFPFLLKLPYDVLDLKMVFRGPLKWHKSIEKRLKSEDQSADESLDKSEDFVDLYLKAIAENEANDLGQTYNRFLLKNTTFDLLIAGSETTATTIRWILLYILHNPETQNRLHSEIDDVIGNDRAPSLTDRSRMPYMEATILESLRIAHPAPLGFPHSVPYDVTFNGYLIRKDTTIIANLSAVLRDAKLWDDPDTFRPERFLSEDGQSVEVPKFFIPFSLGPRSCLGETLARMELFLYMTSLLQKFILKPAEENHLPETKGIFGATYSPQPYEIRFVKR